MKKITLLTAAAMSVLTLAGSTMTANAGLYFNNGTNGTNCINGIIIQGNDISNLQSVYEQLQNCYPEIQFPNLPSIDCIIPDTNTCPPVVTNPDCETPEVETPDPGTPEVENPDPETPEVENPDPETPEVENPDPGIPEVENPDPEIPEVENPDPGTPEVENPDPEETEEPSKLSFIQQVVKLVNIERAKYNLSPVTMDESVREAAQVRAVEIQNSFSHTRPNGKHFTTALKEAGVSYNGAGENIAWGQKSPEEVVTGWMNSEGHRANILNSKFTNIGVGHIQNNSGVHYWSQLFTY